MVSQVRGRCNMCAGGCHEPRCIRSQGRCSQRLHRALGGTRILLAAVVAVAVRIHPCVPFFKADKTETPVPGSDTGVLGGRGWTSRAALLKTAHWAVFALSSATAPQLFESTLVSPFSRLIKQKLRYPLDTGVLGGRGWIARAALLKTAHWAVFAPSSATAPQLFESTRSMSLALLQNKNLSVFVYVEAFWWARVDVASRASKKAPQGLFSPPDCSAGRCCSNPPLRPLLCS